MSFMTLTFLKGPGNSLGVQWLGLRAFTAEGVGLIPGPGTKILGSHVVWPKIKLKKKKKTRLVVLLNVPQPGICLIVFLCLESG